MAVTVTLGRQAEDDACRLLRQRGLAVIGRNVHCRLGEIDIVALEGDCLVFVEVRRRGSGAWIDAAESVDRRKQRKLLNAAAMYLARHTEHQHRDCRFDVIGLSGDEVNWIRDAFRPE